MGNPDRKSRELTAEVLNRMGIPAEFHRLSLNQGIRSLPSVAEEEIVKYSKIYSDVEKWADRVLVGEARNGLFLTGMSGSGKTAVGSALCRKFLRAKKVGRRMTFFEIGTMFFKEGWEIPEEAFGEGLLFIDEISKVVPTKPGYNESILDHILRQRTEAYLPTVLSSIKDSPALEMLHGSEVVSLIDSKFFEVLFPKVNLTIRKTDQEQKKYFNGGQTNEPDRS